MAYLCENCGVVAEDSNSLCNPIDEQYKKKLCSAAEAEVCRDKAPAMKYSCSCGSVSANPQHLCRPTRLS